MVKRVVSSVIGLPILILVVNLGGLTLSAAIALLSLAGMTELFLAISKKILPIHFAAYIAAVFYCLNLQNLTRPYLMVLLSAFLMVVMLLLVIYHERVNVIDCAVTFFAFYYVAFMLSCVYFVRYNIYGKYFVWMIFIAAWGSDTFAYITGRLMGRHRLSRSPSPRKTWEGVAGGVAGAGIIGLIYGLIIVRVYGASTFNVPLFCLITGVVGAVFSQFGDLAASAIKRYAQIKDFGRIILGHGGVLDRFDSVLFTAPGVFIVMVVLFNALTIRL